MSASSGCCCGGGGGVNQPSVDLALPPALSRPPTHPPAAPRQASKQASKQACMFCLALRCVALRCVALRCLLALLARSPLPPSSLSLSVWSSWPSTCLSSFSVRDDKGSPQTRTFLSLVNVYYIFLSCCYFLRRSFLFVCPREARKEKAQHGSFPRMLQACWRPA